MVQEAQATTTSFLLRSRRNMASAHYVSTLRTWKTAISITITGTTRADVECLSACQDPLDKSKTIERPTAIEQAPLDRPATSASAVSECLSCLMRGCCIPFLHGCVVAHRMVRYVDAQMHSHTTPPVTESPSLICYASPGHRRCHSSLPAHLGAGVGEM